VVSPTLVKSALNAWPLTPSRSVAIADVGAAM
jgi:hypothetical protein